MYTRRIATKTLDEYGTEQDVKRAENGSGKMTCAKHFLRQNIVRKHAVFAQFSDFLSEKIFASTTFVGPNSCFLELLLFLQRCMDFVVGECHLFVTIFNYWSRKQVSAISDFLSEPASRPILIDW